MLKINKKGRMKHYARDLDKGGGKQRAMAPQYVAKMTLLILSFNIFL